LDKNVVTGSTKYVDPGTCLTWQNLTDNVTVAWLCWACTQVSQTTLALSTEKDRGHTEHVINPSNIW